MLFDLTISLKFNIEINVGFNCLLRSLLTVVRMFKTFILRTVVSNLSKNFIIINYLILILANDKVLNLQTVRLI